jgi:hypothetical protein
MGRSSFNELARRVRQKVGDDEFKPENKLEEYNAKTTHKGAVSQSGGAICGKVRLAIFYDFFVGASSLDLMVVFDMAQHEKSDDVVNPI